MSLPIVFMYAGQGSQYYQMGRELYDSNPIFKHHLLQADKIYQDIAHHSLIDILYHQNHTKSETFNQTRLTHPAIYMLEYALTAVLLESGIVPTMVLGSSMGEMMAATTAGVLDFETAFIAVINQGIVLEKCAPGAMLAILANPELYENEPYLHQQSELAAINFSNHFIVSCTQKNAEAIIMQLMNKDITYFQLPVSQAFHSSLIDSAHEPFLETMANLTFHTPTLAYVSCTNASSVPVLTSKHYWDVVRNPILIQKTIQTLEAQSPVIYIDVGASGTMATFVKYNLKNDSKSQQVALLTPFGGEAEKNIETIKRLSAL